MPRYHQQGTTCEGFFILVAGTGSHYFAKLITGVLYYRCEPLCFLAHFLSQEKAPVCLQTSSSNQCRLVRVFTHPHHFKSIWILSPNHSLRSIPGLECSSMVHQNSRLWV